MTDAVHLSTKKVLSVVLRSLGRVPGLDAARLKKVIDQHSGLPTLGTQVAGLLRQRLENDHNAAKKGQHTL